MHVIRFSLNSHRKPQPAKRETETEKSYESDSKMLTGSAAETKATYLVSSMYSFCYHAAIEIIQ